jgi:hypothetical protein
MPVCYLAAGDPGRLAARNCRAAMARLTRPGKDADSPGALPQPRGTGIYRFLRCGDGRQTASAAGTVSVVHRGPQGQADSGYRRGLEQHHHNLSNRRYPPLRDKTR